MTFCWGKQPTAYIVCSVTINLNVSVNRNSSFKLFNCSSQLTLPLLLYLNESPFNNIFSLLVHVLFFAECCSLALFFVACHLHVRIVYNKVVPPASRLQLQDVSSNYTHFFLHESWFTVLCRWRRRDRRCCAVELCVGLQVWTPGPPTPKPNPSSPASSAASTSPGNTDSPTKEQFDESARSAHVTSWDYPHAFMVGVVFLCIVSCIKVEVEFLHPSMQHRLRFTFFINMFCTFLK